jgi:hypothetical protein
MSKETAAEAAAETVAASTAASPEPMMFSDLVEFAERLLNMPFSGWVVMLLFVTFSTWLAYAFARHNSLVYVLPLTAVLLILFESSFVDHSATTLLLATALYGVGAAMYGRLT